MDDAAHRVGHALIHGAEQRDLQWLWFDTGDLSGEFTQQRFDGAGVAGALDVEQAGEFALLLQFLDQGDHGLAVATDGGHTGGGVDGRFDVGQLGVSGVELLQCLGGQFHHGHGTQLVLGQGLLALAHEAGTVAGDEHGVAVGQATGGVGRGDLTHGHAHHGCRADAETGEQVGQRDLDGGDGDLRGLGVIGLLIIQDDVHDGPAGLELDHLVEFLDAFAELRGQRAEILDHLAVLGSETGVDEHRAVGSRGIGGGDTHADLALGNLSQAFDGFLDAAGEHHGAGAAVVAACQGTGDRGEVLVAASLQEGGQVGCCLSTARRQVSRHRQRDHDVRELCGLGPVALQVGGVVLRVELGDHHVGVGATEAETGHTGQCAAAVLRPFAGILHNLDALGIEVDVAVGPGVVHRRRQGLVLHGQDDLDDAGDTRGGFGVTEVGLGRTQQGWGGAVAALAEHRTERGGLDRITQDGAGAVGLHVVHGGGIHAGIHVGALEHIDLRIRVGGGQAVGVAVGVHGGPLDHSEDLIAVGNGVGDALEHDHTGAVGTHETVGVIGEGVDLAGRADHTEFSEGGGDKRRGQDVHATGDGVVGVAGAQCAHSLVDGHQGGGTRGVHVDGRSAEVEGVVDAVGHDRARGTGQCIWVRLGRVGGDHHAVVIVGGADEHTDGLAAQRIGRDAGAFQGFPGQFQEDALLRIHVGGLERGQTEELGVEAGDVREVTTDGGVLLHLAGHDLIAGVLGPAADRELTDAVAALHEQFPHLLGVAGTRETGGQAHHGDVVVAGCGTDRGVVELALDVGSLRLAIDEPLRQTTDGRVLVGDGGIEGDIQEVLQLTGEDHDITG